MEAFHQQMMTIQGWYNDWQKKLGGKGESSNEDARFVLPNAAGTKMLVTMNARELTHFFSLRCCNRAQWEIRALSWEMLRLARKGGASPLLQRGPRMSFRSLPRGQEILWSDGRGPAPGTGAELIWRRSISMASTP